MAVPGVSYGEVRNTIKEIDMQIVYRRLEARKKNITNDGKMSKKQLASAYRGYHGLEAQYQAMVRMSDEALRNTKLRNDHLNQRLNEEMRSLEDRRRAVSRNSRREIESVTDEFRAQLAYQYVYKNHSFKRLDNSKPPQRKSRPTSDKPEMYDAAADRKLLTNSSLQRSNSIVRPLGSLRQMESYKNELKFPPLNECIPGEERREKESTKINMMGDKQVVSPRHEKENDACVPPVHVQTKPFPKIEGAMGVEIKYKYKLREDDKDSLFSAPAGFVDDNAVIYAADHDQPTRTRLDMGQNLMRMRQREQENYNRHRALPVPPSAEDVNKQSWRRVLPATPGRPSSVFPREETNPIDHKKAIKKEVTEIIETWDKASKTQRLEIVDKLKQLEREQNRENPPPRFDTSRPTSAILRDFVQYKKAREERRHVAEGDQAITVQQMTVQPRPESPSLARRNEYSARINTPAKLRRTVSEKSDKFSSVSRTASFKDISGDLEEMALYAQMTAAERIEKEKEKRNSAKQRLHETATEGAVEESKPIKGDNAQSFPSGGDEGPVNANERQRRVLPQTPKRPIAGITDGIIEQLPVPDRKYSPGEIYLQEAIKSTKASQNNKSNNKGRMFNTAILATNASTDEKKTSNDDIQMKKRDNVDAIQNKPLPLKKLRPGTPQSNSVVEQHEDKGAAPTSRPSTSPSSSLLYTFSARPIPQHIKDRMRFEYDNYSRKAATSSSSSTTSASARKKLEIRAKNRRKIQQQNRLLQEERGQSFLKDTDRASTQVSFNESVMVFQTI